jgi:hypothetical protein
MWFEGNCDVDCCFRTGRDSDAVKQVKVPFLDQMIM